MRKIVFADTTHPTLPEQLEKAGFHCEHFYGKDPTAFQKSIADATGIIIRSKFPMNEEFLAKAKKLQFIGRVGAGMENIDVNFAQGHNILLFNAPEGNRDAVAEHTMGMLLALQNRLLIVDKEVRKGIWLREENRGTEIHGKTIAIIGFGNMGSAFAQRLKGFDVNVIAYDKYKQKYTPDGVEECSMEEVFKRADVVSLHIPLSKETHYLVDETWINSFKKPITLLNTSRGKIVKTQDLLDRLKKGKIIQAGLDVLEYESSSFEQFVLEDKNPILKELLQSQKLILSPHIAGWTHESNRKLANVIVEKILKHFKQ